MLDVSGDDAELQNYTPSTEESISAVKIICGIWRGEVEGTPDHRPVGDIKTLKAFHIHSLKYMLKKGIKVYISLPGRRWSDTWAPFLLSSC